MLAGTDAVSCVALTNFVVSGELFHSTVAPEVKPAPLTVSVKAALKATMEAGLSAVIEGGGVIVKFNVGEEADPVMTSTLALPALAMKLLGTDAVICVAVT